MAEPKWRFSPASLAIDERFGFYREFAPRARDLLGLEPGMRVLEVGCGSGGFTRLLPAILEGNGEVVAVDHDTKLLDEARQRMPATDGGFTARFEQADAFALPFKDGEFDAVVSMFLLCILPEPLRALAEMRRVTRPGGVIASGSCFCKSGILPTFGGLHAFPGVERLTALHVKFRDAYRTTVRNPSLGIPNGRDLDVWGDHHRAGLEDLRIDGFLTILSPGDARWTDAEGVAYVEQRKAVETGLLDRLSDAQRETLAATGVSAAMLAELRELLDAKYAWLLADPARVRRGMEAVADPSVVIRGRVPPR